MSCEQGILRNIEITRDFENIVKLLSLGVLRMNYFSSLTSSTRMQKLYVREGNTLDDDTRRLCNQDDNNAMSIIFDKFFRLIEFSRNGYHLHAL